MGAFIAIIVLGGTMIGVLYFAFKNAAYNGTINDDDGDIQRKLDQQNDLLSRQNRMINEQLTYDRMRIQSDWDKHRKW